MSEPQLTTHEQALYLYALRLLPGIGPQTLLALAKKLIEGRNVSLLSTIPGMSAEELSSIFGHSLAQKVCTAIGGRWGKSYLSAQSMIDQHIEMGIRLLPITSDEYPTAPADQRCAGHPLRERGYFCINRCMPSPSLARANQHNVVLKQHG